MRVSAVAITLTALLTGAVAQLSEAGLPTCAQNCVQIPSSCNTLDIKCICSAKDFINNITCCIARSCNQADQEATVKFAQQLCGTAGVTVPSSVVCSSGSSSISGASKTSSVASTPNAASPKGTSTATNSGSGTTTSATAASNSSGTSAAAPIVHSQNGGAFAAVGAAAAFVAMLLM